MTTLYRNSILAFNRAYKLARSEKVARLIKFGIVGASGIIVNNALLLILTLAGMHELFAALLATETAIISNFLGNSAWTWRQHKHGSWLKRFALFQSISMMTGILTVALFWLFRTNLSMPLLIANTGAIFVTFILNFTLNSKITWRKQANATHRMPLTHASTKSSASLKVRP